jgi:hypothetical protein
MRKHFLYPGIIVIAAMIMFSPCGYCFPQGDITLLPVANGTYLERCIGTGYRQVTCIQDGFNPAFPPLPFFKFNPYTENYIAVRFTGYYEEGLDPSQLLAVTDMESGVLEFDIQGIKGLLSSGNFKAYLSFKIKQVNITDESFYVYSMEDASESGTIGPYVYRTEGEAIQEISGPMVNDQIISIDVTEALEHDLFGSQQTDFSGFVLNLPENIELNWFFCAYGGICPNNHSVVLYNRNDSGNEPRLVISDVTLIGLAELTANPKSSTVEVRWSTESEIENAGFNIYRAESKNGEYTKINNFFIPAKGSTTQGASYEFIDTNVRNRKTYWYKLEDTDLNGISTMHGPVSATPRLIYEFVK